MYEPVYVEDDDPASLITKIDQLRLWADKIPVGGCMILDDCFISLGTLRVLLRTINSKDQNTYTLKATKMNGHQWKVFKEWEGKNHV